MFSYKLEETLTKNLLIMIKERKIEISSNNNNDNISNNDDHFSLFLNAKNQPFITDKELNNSRHKTCAFINYFKYTYFNRTKKIITPTILRKSVVTNLMEKKTCEENMKNLAEAMLHSYPTQQRYYSKLSAEQRSQNIQQIFALHS